MKSELISKIEKYNLINKTFEFFEENFYHYSIEDKDEFDRYFPEYNVKKRKVELYVVRYNVYDYNYPNEKSEDTISVELEISYDFNTIGKYICLFLLDGTFFDDYFIIDWVKLY